MPSLGTLSAKITADTSGLTRAEGVANRAFGGMARIAGRAMRTIAVAVGAATGALVALGKTSMTQVDAQTKLARSLGMTTAEFQKMALVANEAGVSQEKLSVALGMMQRNIVLSEKALAQFGIQVRELRGLAPEEQFARIAEQINSLQDPAERAAAAMTVFGRSGREAIGMLEDYAVKADNARAFQEKFGIAVSEIDAANIEAANDALGRIGQVLRGVGNMIAAYVAPLIQKMADAFLDSGIDADMFRAAGEKAVAIVGGAVDILRRALIAVRIGFNAIAVAVTEFARIALAALKPVAIALDAITSLMGGPGGLADSIGELDASITGKQAEAIETIKGLLEDWQNFESTFDAMNRIRQEAADNVVPADGSGRRNSFIDPDAPGGGGGGGGGEFERRFEALQDSLAREMELLDEWYHETHDLLLEALDRKMITEEEYMTYRERLEAEHQSRLNGIRDRANAHEVNARRQTMGALVGLLQQFGRENKAAAAIAVAINAAQRVSEIAASTAAASVRALAELGPVAGPPAAARIQMFGRIQQGIALASAALNFSGGGGGSFSAGGGGASAGGQSGEAAPIRAQNLNVTLRNDPFGVGEDIIRQLAEGLNASSRNGMQLRIVRAR